MNDKMRYQVFYRDLGRCQYCGYDLTSSYAAHGAFEIDHIKHKDDDSLENLALSCRACNAILGTPGHDESLESRRLKVQETLKNDKLKWMPEVKNMTDAARALIDQDKSLSVRQTGRKSYKVIGWHRGEDDFKKIQNEIHQEFGVQITKDE